MRILIWLAFVLAGLSPALLRPVYTLYWSSHREAIAKNWCENKDKPEKKCAGKCQLKKQSGTSEENPGGKAPFFSQLLQEWDIIFDEGQEMRIRLIAARSEEMKEYYKVCLHKGHLNLPERPPCIG